MQKRLFTVLAATGLLFTPVALAKSALAQRVVEVSPEISSQTVSPDASISGQFDAGNGPAVDPNSVQIFVNGQNVTNQSTVTRNFFTYRPDQPFPPGLVQVRVDYRNINGNQRSVSWSFNVQQPQSAVQITSVTHNAATGSLGAGATFLTTINGTPRAQASLLLVQDGQTVRELPAQEVSPGVYVATLEVQASDRINEGIVIGRLRRQNQTTYAAASQPVVFSARGRGATEAPPTANNLSNGTTTGTAQAPLQPRFTSHRDNEQVRGSGFTLVGETRRNARVRINVSSSISVLGINVAGETLLDREVTANNNGRFEVEVPAPRIPVPGTRYTISATARDGDETSPQTQITLVHRN